MQVADNAEISSVVFKKGTTELNTGDGFVDGGYAAGHRTIKFIKTIEKVAKTDGDDYLCEFNFMVGDSISATTTVAIHSEYTKKGLKLFDSLFYSFV